MLVSHQLCRYTTFAPSSTTCRRYSKITSFADRLHRGWGWSSSTWRARPASGGQALSAVRPSPRHLLRILLAQQATLGRLPCSSQAHLAAGRAAVIACACASLRLGWHWKSCSSAHSSVSLTGDGAAQCGQRRGRAQNSYLSASGARRKGQSSQVCHKQPGIRSPSCLQRISRPLDYHTYNKFCSSFSCGVVVPCTIPPKRACTLA